MSKNPLADAIKRQSKKGLLTRQASKFNAGNQATLGMMNSAMTQPSGGGDMANPSAIAAAMGKGMKRK